MIEGIAGWVAPIATMIAAMMTAANLGARVTGWGFVVFVVGSIAWTTIGLSSGQTNLIAANGFLTAVNIFGVWRWLGREARYHDDAQVVAKATDAKAMPTLTSLTDIVGRDVKSASGTTLGQIVDAMIARDDNAVGGLLVRHGGVGGVGERVVLLTPDSFDLKTAHVATRLSADDLAALPDAKEAASTLP